MYSPNMSGTANAFSENAYEYPHIVFLLQNEKPFFVGGQAQIACPEKAATSYLC